jgi:hypothetical protein
MADYNYSEFVMANEQQPFADFPHRLPVGDTAPSFPLEDLATGATVSMDDLWRTQVAVMEFGSFT